MRLDSFNCGSLITLAHFRYLNESDAMAQGLTYLNSNGNAIIKVDNTTWSTSPTYGRSSVYMMSQGTVYVGTLILFQARHMPYGCGVCMFLASRSFATLKLTLMLLYKGQDFGLWSVPDTSARTLTFHVVLHRGVIRAIGHCTGRLISLVRGLMENVDRMSAHTFLSHQKTLISRRVINILCTQVIENRRFTRLI